MRKLVSPFIADAALLASVSAAPITFSETGAYQSYIVPIGVTSILFDILGASGGDGSGNYNVYGGAGAEVKGSLSVTAGEILYIFVGGAGQNSGAGGFNGVAYRTLVPEPSTFALFGLGAFVFLSVAKRKKKLNSHYSSTG